MPDVQEIERDVTSAPRNLFDRLRKMNKIQLAALGIGVASLIIGFIAWRSMNNSTTAASSGPINPDTGLPVPAGAGGDIAPLAPPAPYPLGAINNSTGILGRMTGAAADPAATYITPTSSLLGLLGTPAPSSSGAPSNPYSGTAGAAPVGGGNISSHNTSGAGSDNSGAGGLIGAIASHVAGAASAAAAAIAANAGHYHNAPPAPAAPVVPLPIGNHHTYVPPPPPQQQQTPAPSPVTTGSPVNPGRSSGNQMV